MSTALREFCRSWLVWVERGAPEGKPHSRNIGLCPCACRFDGWRKGPATAAVRRQLDLDFRGEDSMYPFGGEGIYEVEQDSATMHLNPERLAWARKYAELEERHE